MAQKKLGKGSKHSDLDPNGDGIVSDAELAAVEALEKHESGLMMETCLPKIGGYDA